LVASGVHEIVIRRSDREIGEVRVHFPCAVVSPLPSTYQIRKCRLLTEVRAPILAAHSYPHDQQPSSNRRRQQTSPPRERNNEHGAIPFPTIRPIPGSGLWGRPEAERNAADGCDHEQNASLRGPNPLADAIRAVPNEFSILHLLNKIAIVVYWGAVERDDTLTQVDQNRQRGEPVPLCLSQFDPDRERGSAGGVTAPPTFS
jgi:hypothetical protein